MVKIKKQRNPYFESARKKKAGKIKPKKINRSKKIKEEIKDHEL